MKLEIFKIVKDVITEKPNLRNDDFMLISYIYSHIYGVGNLPLQDVLENHKFYNLPSMASIVRARRKAQVEDPSLQASKGATEARIEEEQLYKSMMI